MKKNIFFLIFLTFSIIGYAQNINKIKNQNAFFILFEKADKFADFYCSPKNIPKNVIKHCNYKFNSTDDKEFEYSFYYVKYPSFDHMNDNIYQRMVFRVNKSFLRKNKDIIITRKFLEKLGTDAALRLLDDDSTNKTIFIINTAETKNGKILLREVTIDYMKGE